MTIIINSIMPLKVNENSNDFLKLAQEYFQAAESLYQLQQKYRPLAFCYIQATELLLKGLVEQQHGLSEELRKSHNLEFLWDALDKAPQNLTSLIKELSSIDPKTTRFRYPQSSFTSVDIDYIRERVLQLNRSFFN